MIADKIKELRERKGLSQIEMANKLNIQQGSYSNYERGKRTPDIETLKKISNYFGVSIDYLADNKNQKTTINKLEEILNDKQKRQLEDTCKIYFPDEYKKIKDTQ